MIFKVFYKIRNKKNVFPPCFFGCLCPIPCPITQLTAQGRCGPPQLPQTKDEIPIHGHFGAIGMEGWFFFAGCRMVGENMRIHKKWIYIESNGFSYHQKMKITMMKLAHQPPSRGWEVSQTLLAAPGGFRKVPCHQWGGLTFLPWILAGLRRLLGGWTCGTSTGQSLLGKGG